ncbi:hypothetical protein [Aliarcobacter butzleri]|uniref:hypothetical protein n=1 Tax=Aliarcobacter butzleri TaxID=28197 RepID=UPI00125F146A|nr:hypothetical protein [Aliarcobacter butzleri]
MTKIIVNGKAEHVQVKDYQGNKTTIVQMINKSDKKGFEVIKIKLIDESVIVKEGDIINIPVSISTMNNSIFYTQNGKIEIVKA